MPPPQQFSGTLVALAFASGFLFARAYGGGDFRRAVERAARRALAPGDYDVEEEGMACEGDTCGSRCACGVETDSGSSEQSGSGSEDYEEDYEDEEEEEEEQQDQQDYEDEEEEDYEEEEEDGEDEEEEQYDRHEDQSQSEDEQDGDTCTTEDEEEPNSEGEEEPNSEDERFIDDADADPGASTAEQVRIAWEQASKVTADALEKAFENVTVDAAAPARSPPPAPPAAAPSSSRSSSPAFNTRSRSPNRLSPTWQQVGTDGVQLRISPGRKRARGRSPTRTPPAKAEEAAQESTVGEAAQESTKEAASRGGSFWW